MTVKQKLELHEIQMIFFEGMMKYPNDKDRLARGMKIIENFIDQVAADECAKVVAEMNAIQMKTGKKIIN